MQISKHVRMFRLNLCHKGIKGTNGTSRQDAAYVAEMVLRVPVQTITSTITVVGEK